MATGYAFREPSVSPPTQPMEFAYNSQDNVEELLAQIEGVSAGQDSVSATRGGRLSPPLSRSARSGSHNPSEVEGGPSPHFPQHHPPATQQTPPVRIKGGYETGGNVRSDSWDNLVEAVADEESEGLCCVGSDNPIMVIGGCS